MTAVPAAQRMTAQDLLGLPAPEDGRRLELVEGELVVHLPADRHDFVLREILFALETWARARPGRGRPTMLAVGLDRSNFFAPDIAWYREETVSCIRDPQPYPLCDLAVEVRSPSTWTYDLGAKKAAYERHGLPELWLVDTRSAEVLVFRRSAPGVKRFDVALELGRNQSLTSPLLPEFRLAVGQLFPDE